MRLINTKTLMLEEHSMGFWMPKYAILSHTWSTDEVSFQEVQGLSPEERKKLASDLETEIGPQTTPSTGYVKIKHTCQRARREGIKYAWVDTCCIDKTSSAELSEAINSMMEWYENSEVCYAYLADVPPGVDLESKESAFVKSRWFTRGWTLQELLAPNRLVFLASDWSYLFSREKVSILIGNITGIPLSLLGPRKGYNLRGALSEFSIARRMSWASYRGTTRWEDMAYCLLGIFGINMPLLYGEGGGAFLRLQEEIIKHSDDQSLFVWNSQISVPYNLSLHSSPRIEDFGFHYDRHLVDGFLASSPWNFADGGGLVSCSVGGSSAPFSITNKGLSMKAPLLKGQYGIGLLLLECQTSRDLTRLFAVPVKCLKENIYTRLREPIHVAERDAWLEWPSTELYLLTTDPIMRNDNPPDFTVFQHIPPGLRMTGLASPYPCDLKNYESAEIDGMILMTGNIASEIQPWHSNAWIRFEEKGDNSRAFVLCFTLFYNGDKDTPLQLAGFKTECRLIHLQDKGREMDRAMHHALKLWVEQGECFPKIGEENEVSWRVEAVPEKLSGETRRGVTEIFIIPIFLSRAPSKPQIEPRKPPLTLLRDSVRPLLVPGVREQLLRVKLHRVLQSFLRSLRFLPWYVTFVVDMVIQNACSWGLRRSVVCFFLGYLVFQGLSFKGLCPWWMRYVWRKASSKKSKISLVILYVYGRLLHESIFGTLLD